MPVITDSNQNWFRTRLPGVVTGSSHSTPKPRFERSFYRLQKHYYDNWVSWISIIIFVLIWVDAITYKTQPFLSFKEACINNNFDRNLLHLNKAMYYAPWPLGYHPFSTKTTGKSGSRGNHTIWQIVDSVQKPHCPITRRKSNGLCRFSEALKPRVASVLNWGQEA